MSTLSQTVSLSIDHKQAAVHLLTEAFLNDPMMSFVVPNENKRYDFVYWSMKTVVNYSFLYGMIYTTPNLEGVACWLPPGHESMTFGRMFKTRMYEIFTILNFSELKRFFENMRYIESNHKHAVKEKHWYLWAIGVDPACQGKGIGGKLLKPVLDKASENQTCCYLETHNSKNTLFYEKYGFNIVSDKVIPKQKQQVWVMVRIP